MNNPIPYDFECTARCTSVQHADKINAAISKRDVSDEELCAYIASVCQNCENVRDSSGRTALHVAASCGRSDLASWLVKYRQANINLKDAESGYTPLHCSVFYGKLHTTVALLDLGANVALLDADSLTCFEHAMKDGIRPNACSGDLYVWGSNTNNSLGLQKERKVPDNFSDFVGGDMVKQVCISKFHTIIVTEAGTIYSCGHGQGGRLGLGMQQSVVVPRRVTLPNSPVTCVQAAVGRDHSLFLGSDGSLYACGMNENRVLGISSITDVALSPKQLPRINRTITNICCSDYHSVAWGPTCLYAWGLNIGQFGLEKVQSETGTAYIKNPRHINLAVLSSSGVTLHAVQVSEGATCVYTNKGDMYLLYNYKIRKIASKQLNMVQISVVGASKLEPVSGYPNGFATCELKVAALTNTGNIWLWQESDPHLCRCVFNLSRAIVVRQVALNSKELLCVSRDGEAFKAQIRARRNRINANQTNLSAFHQFVERDDCVHLKLTKISRIYRAIAVQSDVKGLDYCVIQAPPHRPTKPSLLHVNIGEELPTELTRILTDHSFSDISFRVDGRLFAAHRFIVNTHCSKLSDLLVDDVVDIHNCLCDIFEQLLLYCYTGGCALLKCGACDFPMSDGEVDPIKMLHTLAGRLGCKILQKKLASLEIVDGIIGYKVDANEGLMNHENSFAFDRMSLPQYFDVKIICNDGKTLNAHKCVLAARTNYFDCMFSSRWSSESETVVHLNFCATVVSKFLDYIYTASVALDELDMNAVFSLIILSDQLVVNALKQQCELRLCDMVSLKNAMQMIKFTEMYNCDNLILFCLRFIVLNILPFLESQQLKDLDRDKLVKLSEIYWQERVNIQCRMITPYSYAPSDNEIKLAYATYPIDINSEKSIVKASSKNSSSSGHKRNRIQNKKNLHDSSVESALENISQMLPQQNRLSEPVENDDTKCRKSAEHANKRIDAILTVQNTLHPEKPLYTPLREHFPSLQEKLLRTSQSLHHGSPVNGDTITSTNIRKINKVSQRQRKRMSSCSETDAVGNISATSQCSTSPLSLSVSPKSEYISSSLRDIIGSEIKQKENLVKVRNRQIAHVLAEERAIKELTKFYNCDGVEDELISVSRVEIGAVAVPKWLDKH